MKTKLLFSALCTFFSLSLFAVVPTPVADYALSTNFNNTVGTTFGSMDGTNTTFATDSIFTSVVDFNGTDAYVEMDPALYNFAAVSINIWFKCNSVDTWSRIFTFGLGNNNRLPEVFFTPADGRTFFAPGFGIDLTTGATGTCTDVSDSVTALNVDQWYMLTCCADITFGYLYLDGVLIDKKDISARDTAPSGYLFDIAWLGKSGWTADPMFSGQMTKMKVYDKILTVEEINAVRCSDDPTAVGCSVGVKTIANTKGINLYSKDRRIYVSNLTSSRSAFVTVYDLTGKMVQLKSISDISTVQFGQGLYIVKISGNDINYSSKIVIR